MDVDITKNAAVRGLMLRVIEAIRQKGMDGDSAAVERLARFGRSYLADTVNAENEKEDKGAEITYQKDESMAQLEAEVLVALDIAKA